MRARKFGRGLGIRNVSDTMQEGRLRWFGHVERRDEGDWVSACTYMTLAGERRRS